MLLAVDIGNSNIVIGVYGENRWKSHWRILTVPDKSAEQYISELTDLFEHEGLDFGMFAPVIISSVVPRLTPLFKQIFTERNPDNVFILDGTKDTGIRLATDSPEEVGSDLIADAVAAYDMIGDTCLVVDFGTATTIMAVKKPGVLAGGAICAGMEVTASALIGKAAMLADISLEPPGEIIGTTTEKAMQSGLFMGHLYMVEGLVDRMKKELGPVRVVATGGLAEKMAPHTTVFDVVEPYLTLEGLRIVAEHQRSGT